MMCPSNDCDEELEVEVEKCRSPYGGGFVTEEWTTVHCPNCGDMTDLVDPQDVAEAAWERDSGV